MNAEITAIGKRQPGDDRAAPAVQEQEDDGDRQQGAFDQRVLDAVERARDPVAVGVDEAQLDARRHGLAQLGGGGLDRLAGRDDVVCSLFTNCFNCIFYNVDEHLLHLLFIRKNVKIDFVVNAY